MIMATTADRKIPSPGDAPRLLLTRSQLASAFNVTPLRITKWTADGMPVADRGGKGRQSKYDLNAVVDWEVERRLRARGGGRSNGAAIDLSHERAKLARAQTVRTMLDVGSKKKDLLPAEEVRRVFGGAVHAVRAGLLALPQALAERCAAVSADGAAAVEAVLKIQVYDLLRSLAQWPKPLLDPADEACA
jgi:phage terminase Nu1 subunit (DNA packaging protein)